MTALIVDASAVTEALAGNVLFRIRMQEAGSDLHAPALCDIEVVSALVRMLRRGNMSAERAGQLLRDFVGLPLQRHAHGPLLLERVLQLHNNFSPYDATYVALSEELNAPLLTADARLARAVRSHTAIRVLPDE